MGEICSSNTFYFLLVLCVVALLTPSHASDGERKVYIVYMGNLGERDQSHSLHHFNMLQEVVDTSFARKSLVRSYTRSFNGFAANLTVQEKEKLASHEDVVSIFPSTTLHPQTTRSWDFMGFPENVHRNPTIESDTIIGVIDTGIWPESDSFDDKGFSTPPPKKWKGACKGGTNFTCNKKIIGARYYNSQFPVDDSARDREGHGTHTASTAAGNYVKNTSFYGLAKGTARGGVPSARIAAYKVCYPVEGCKTEDILAAFDDAVADGVDIITISIGGSQPSALESDAIAIGSLHASLKGILVVQAAGNNQNRGSVVSTPPWIFSVAASTTDRGIIDKVVLGNGAILTGKAVNSFDLRGTDFPLAYGKEIGSSICNEEAAKSCRLGCLNDTLVKGKIVLCDSGMLEPFLIGASGSITLTNVNVSNVVPFPALGLNSQEYSIVKSYFNSIKNPKATILTSEIVKNLDAPRVAIFSSRGPNTIIPDILKPDITAPGVEILAAWSPSAAPSLAQGDNRSVNYSIISGTSMACPHVAGAAAYVNSMHPDWSASAIKSALMTTAWRMNATEDPDAEFSYGSGHIDPIKAADPGLVYQTSPEDYPKMLCSLGYDSSTLKKIFGVNISCSKRVSKAPKDVNYPSMAFSVNTTTQSSNESIPFLAKFTRTVTNVGNANSTYKATIKKSSEYNISVSPSVLTFGALNEKKSFEVIVSGKMNGEIMSASLEWSDGLHSVRSPIVVY